MRIGETADARKEKLAAEAAWEIIAQAGEVVIAKGNKTLRFVPNPADRADILAAALGRGGNLRAPALRVGGRVIIGYNEEIYSELGA